MRTPASLSPSSAKSLRVAIVHDWLTVYAGAERVLEQILHCYPQADLYSTVDFLPAAERFFLQGKTVNTSFIQHLPFAKTKYRAYLPLMPLAIEQFDLSPYDLVISSSYAVAKGVITGPDQYHICYCHSPIRYAWDLQHQYLKEARLSHGLRGWIAKYFLHKIRIWDLRTANGVDQFIANSRFIARRIYKVYRRDSVVINPPVSLDSFAISEQKGNFYLTASRLVPYKKIDLIVKAFAQMPNKQLIVIGDGPDYEKIKQIATPNVSLLGYQAFDVLRSHLQQAKAFIFAAEEDFGIAPLEAQACGTPVIAYGKGGVLETIQGLPKDSPTGIFFSEQSEKAIQEAVELFEGLSTPILPSDCRQNAMRFSQERFCEQLKSFVNQAMASFSAKL